MSKQTGEWSKRMRVAIEAERSRASSHSTSNLFLWNVKWGRRLLVAQYVVSVWIGVKTRRRDVACYARWPGATVKFLLRGEPPVQMWIAQSGIVPGRKFGQNWGHIYSPMSPIRPPEPSFKNRKWPSVCFLVLIHAISHMQDYYAHSFGLWVCWGTMLCVWVAKIT